MEFFKSVGLPYQPITDDEFDKLQKDLATTAIASGAGNGLCVRGRG